MIIEKKEKNFVAVRHEGFMAFWHGIRLGQNPYHIPGSKNYSFLEMAWHQGWQDAQLEKRAEDRM